MYFYFILTKPTICTDVNNYFYCQNIFASLNYGNRFYFKQIKTIKILLPDEKNNYHAY